MRFRTTSMGWTVYWVVLALGFIVLLANHLRVIHLFPGYGKSSIPLFLFFIFLFFCLFNIYTRLASRIELQPAHLLVHNGVRSTRVPYDDIIAVRHARSRTGEQLPHQIEIETADPDRDLYPNGQRSLFLSDPAAFIRALRDKAPHAKYKPAGCPTSRF